MPTWKKVIVSGSNAVLNSVTASNGFFGTASWAITASHALNAGGGTPGGANTTIQFNDSSTFSGSGNFTFKKSTNEVQLTGSLIVSNSLDTANRYLINASGNPTFDWSTATIYDGNGTGPSNLVYDGNFRTFYASDLSFLDMGVVPIYYDSNGSSSIELASRGLKDQNSNTALAWTDINSNNGVRLYGTASYALTASFVVGGTSNVKAGSGSAASFGGSPRTGSITFGTAFSNNNYAVTVTGEDARSWTIENKSSTGFRINSNSSVALTGPVYWIATPFSS